MAKEIEIIEEVKLPPRKPARTAIRHKCRVCNHISTGLPGSEGSAYTCMACGSLNVFPAKLHL